MIVYCRTVLLPLTGVYCDVMNWPGLYVFVVFVCARCYVFAVLFVLGWHGAA